VTFVMAYPIWGALVGAALRTVLRMAVAWSGCSRREIVDVKVLCCAAIAAREK